jgi:hypothetical protein
MTQNKAYKNVLNNFRCRLFDNKFKYLEALYLFVDLTYDITPDPVSEVINNKTSNRTIDSYYDAIIKLGCQKWGDDPEFLYGLSYIIIYCDLYLDQEFIEELIKKIEKINVGNPLFDLYFGRLKLTYEDRNTYFRSKIVSNQKYVTLLKKYGELNKYIIDTHWNSDSRLLIKNKSK